MKGADEYYDLIGDAIRCGLGGLKRMDNMQNIRWNNVVFTLSTHARGKCFYIRLIDGMDGGESLEVYGITCGQPGWTEEYGWVKRGAWVDVILEYFERLKAEVDAYNAERERLRLEKKAESDRLLADRVAKFNGMFTEVDA
jgi:hypothetical protein